VSGLPWVTGSVVASAGNPVKIKFETVTKNFTVSNTGGNVIHVGFTLNGVISGSNYFAIATTEEKLFNIRIRDLYIFNPSGGSTFDVVAAVTGISRNSFPNITGSNPPPTGSQFISNIG
jgi:hypothetical protein